MARLPTPLRPWRINHPKLLLFSRTRQRHRLDYCFMSLPIFDDHLQDSGYTPPGTYYHEDHHLIRFRLVSDLPSTNTHTLALPLLATT